MQESPWTMAYDNNRLMVCDLLQLDGHIAGAVRSYNFSHLTLSAASV
jgi:hypothetical protein